MAETIASNKVWTFVDFSLLFSRQAISHGCYLQAAWKGSYYAFSYFLGLLAGKKHIIGLSWGRGEGRSKGEEGRGRQESRKRAEKEKQG